MHAKKGNFVFGKGPSILRVDRTGEGPCVDECHCGFKCTSQKDTEKRKSCPDLCPEWAILLYWY